MKQAIFKDWTLNTLDEAFNLKQVWQSELLDNWEQADCEITDIDKHVILHLQKSLIRGGRAWNETELENKFISPLIMQADIDDEEIGYFLERKLSSIVGDYQLSGIVDGMIATGFREPKVPLFCIHEYKRSIENQGSPDAQVLAAMLVAKELNENQLPIYGMFMVGLIWNFIVLKDNEYCISRDYSASNDDIFAIFKILKTLKKIIKTELHL
ncbi:MAG: hypothetical protein GQ569_01430 [Methylococcaceae bacterium]|nr:hypothetical protein [Methylococcaceae bacterium]